MLGAGDLDQRVAFDQRVDIDDGEGNTKGEWQEQFVRWAAFKYAGGSEAVMAARLDGQGVMKIVVRSCSKTRLIKTDWRLRDARRGTIYNITDVDAVTDRAWVYIVARSGLPA